MLGVAGMGSLKAAAAGGIAHCRRTTVAMTIVASALWVFGAGAAPTFAAGTLYVAPTGTPSGDGSATRPLDILTALSSSSPARPGDTIWVRGGTYRGPIEARLSGTVAAPITVRQYPGERATIDGYPNGGTPLSIIGSNLVFWGLEVMSSDPSRVSGQNSRAASGIDVLGANDKVINMVVHDNINGIGAWMVPDSELYGNIIYNNGVEDSDRGHGHSIYAQNNSGTKRIIDNVLFNSYSIGMQAYTQGGRIDNIYLEGNIAFNHGILSQVSGAKANFLWQGPSAINPSLVSNYSYYSPGRNGRTADLTGGCTNAVIKDNYLVQGWIRFECGAATITGNTIYGDPGAVGSYSSNTFLGSRPTGVQVFVRPNRYEVGRANIAIFNWAGQAQVSVNLSSAGLATGTAYDIRDAENFYGAPVLSGTYDGNPVSIRMTGLTAVGPIGGAYTPPHTAPEFGAFVVIPRTSGGPGPTASLSASPATITDGQSTTLAWSTSGASSVSIAPGLGVVAANGSVVISPNTTTTYTLTASGTSGSTVQYFTVTVVLPPSPDGAMVPGLTQLVDAGGNVWTLGSGNRTLRNGAQAGGGIGLKLLWVGGYIYTFGTDNNWWQWTGVWVRIGPTQPGPTATVSPDGSMVPTLTQLVDAGGNIWTLGSGGRTLKNGLQVGGGIGTKLLWFGGAIYTFGTDSNWWRWNAALGVWERLGPTQPGGSSGASPDGSMVPTLTQLVDAAGGVWTLASDGRTMRNAVQAGGGFGSKLLWSGGIIYTFARDNNWWRWDSLGGAWVVVGPIQPGPSSTSPDGAMVPSLTQLVDSSGNVWTLASDGRTMRNGLQAGGGFGSKLLWSGGTIYTFARDNNWWRWNTGTGAWQSVGPAQPGG